MTDSEKNILEFHLPSSKVTCHLNVDWQIVLNDSLNRKIILITDSNIYKLYENDFAGLQLIVIQAGEENKTQVSADLIIDKLIEYEADNNCLLVGFGGGVITDLTGYAGSIYKRGIPFAFIPTTVLAMADAAIGGKNGINHGLVKNIVGTIRQPLSIIYDFQLLKTLPAAEWVNGFAEIIKYACIIDDQLFEMLEKYDLDQIQADISLAARIIERCLKIKMKYVSDDENDSGERRKLNFGHTFGHAVERLYQLTHGQAISMGIVAACKLSEKLADLHFNDTNKIVQLLKKYHLLVHIEINHSEIFQVMKLDKKRNGKYIHFILLNKIGDAVIYPIEINYLEAHINEIL